MECNYVLHPIEGLCNVASIFNGSYRDRSFRCLDFIGTQFNIEINESYGTNTRTTNISSNNNFNDTADIDDNAINNNVEQIEKGFLVQHSGEYIGRCTLIEFAASLSPSTMSSIEAYTSTVTSNNDSPFTIIENDDDKTDGDVVSTRSNMRSSSSLLPPPIRFVTLLETWGL
mmetsp:Transcript_36565/g.42028  ORF Transcript_36565/g.42028 Transcript_36565/m.42028 type:complete len:172 (+) Transcript_36565:161-676(+)